MRVRPTNISITSITHSGQYAKPTLQAKMLMCSSSVQVFTVVRKKLHVCRYTTSRPKQHSLARQIWNEAFTTTAGASSRHSIPRQVCGLINKTIISWTAFLAKRILRFAMPSVIIWRTITMVVRSFSQVSHRVPTTASES